MITRLASKKWAGWPNTCHSVCGPMHMAKVSGRASDTSHYYTCVHAVPLKITWNCFFSSSLKNCLSILPAQISLALWKRSSGNINSFLCISLALSIHLNCDTLNCLSMFCYLFLSSIRPWALRRLCIYQVQYLAIVNRQMFVEWLNASFPPTPQTSLLFVECYKFRLKF